MKTRNKTTYSILISTIFLCNNVLLNGQEYTVNWAKTFGGSGFEAVKSICTDSKANLYITGYFHEVVDFGEYKLKALGSDDIYVAKINQSGTVEWAKSIGSTYSEPHAVLELGTCIVTDELDNVYVGGQFTTRAYIDGQYITTQGKVDIFIAKFTSNGDLIWIKSFGGYNSDKITALQYSNQGYLYFTGYASKGFNFDPNNKLDNNGSIYIAKMDTSGSYEWIKSFKLTSSAGVRAINADKSGNILLGLDFMNQFEINENKVLVSKGDRDIALLWFNSDGILTRSKHFGGIDKDIITDINIDNNDQFVISGFFSDKIELDGQTLVSKGMSDIFVMKLTTDYEIAWLKSIGYKHADESYAAVVSESGDIFISGVYTISTTIINSTIFAIGLNDSYILRVSPSGILVSFYPISGSEHENLSGMAITKEDNIYLTGSFNGIIEINSEKYFTSGAEDIFVSSIKVGESKWIYK